MSQWLANHRVALAAALLIAAGFFAFNFILLHRGHFHEDAYILFIYVENFLNGFGISYYPGGPPTEGATDFLWLLLLILLSAAGFDVGTAAIVLNSAGVGLIAFVFANEIVNARLDDRWLRLLLAPFALFWLFDRTLEAAVGGFSVYLYSALVLLAYVSIYKRRYLIFTPWLSIATALFRPDGVIIGVATTLMGFYRACGTEVQRRYLIGCTAAVLLGIGYFIWRTSYFGNLLPLPLYVKSSSSGLAGLADNIDWLQRYRIYLYPLLLLIVFNRQSLRYVLWATPVLLLFAALMTATQSQNVGYRFQAPVFVVMYYILLLSLIDVLTESRRRGLKKVLLGLLLPVYVFEAHHNLTRAVTSVTAPNYINTFPLAIRKVLSADASIALTEAGRIAYWNQRGGELIDVVGLNTTYAAKNRLTPDYLVQHSPDLIMFNHAGSLAPVDSAVAKRPVLVIDDFNVGLIEPDGWDNEDHKFREALEVLLAYLGDNAEQYRVFLADYAGDASYLHVYAVKRELGIEDELYAALLHSFEASAHQSYYAMKERIAAEVIASPKDKR